LKSASIFIRRCFFLLIEVSAQSAVVGKLIQKSNTMKYAYTILYVKDVSDTIDFYEKAFGFKRKFVTPENDYAELISGETTIAFASIELGNSNLNG
jgi:hypothetical protein